MQPVEGVHEPGDYGGNFVTLEIAPGIYAFYAHLEPDSITVAVGDRVTTGQMLGLLGNTGNSTAPHLHFGLNDDPDPLAAESLPMAFNQWTLEGTIPPEVYLGADPATGVPDLTPQGAPSEQSGTLQLFLDVANFG
jgi:murein DD-endopeptidase MepM/ murein hydrolase activator NlpD